MDLEAEGDLYDGNYKADEEELFSACLHLGRLREEHDLVLDTVVVRFRRDVDEEGTDGKRNWERSLTTIRRLLKKYHSHEDLPMRRCLAKWRILRDKLLPMITLYHRETCVVVLRWLQLRALPPLPSAPTPRPTALTLPGPRYPPPLSPPRCPRAQALPVRGGQDPGLSHCHPRGGGQPLQAGRCG